MRAITENVKARIASTIENKLARQSATIALGQVLRLGLQACYFVAIARSLGSNQYGVFVAITAIAAICAPFAGLGAPNILLKNVSRDATALPLYWGNGIVLILTSGAVFTLAVLGIGPYFVGRSMWLAILLVCLSDLVLIRVVELASFAATSLGEMGLTARLNVYISLSRLVGILFVIAIARKPTVQEWTIAYFASSAICFLYALIVISRRAGFKVNLSRAKAELVESSYFAVAGSAVTVYNDIDKTMLARLADFSSTGIYGAAYRIIDVSMAPVRGMTAAAYPEFFRRGLRGPKVTEAYAWSLIRRAVPFGVLIFIGCLLGASLLPYVLGPSFRASVEAIRWLAIIPLLRCIHLFLADALSGAGYQGTRTIIQVSVGAANIILNLYFISQWTWRGAAWSSVLCDAVLVLSFWTALRQVSRTESPREFIDLPLHEKSAAC